VHSRPTDVGAEGEDQQLEGLVKLIQRIAKWLKVNSVVRWMISEIIR
jgi:hypothetical protein